MSRKVLDSGLTWALRGAGLSGMLVYTKLLPVCLVPVTRA